MNKLNKLYEAMITSWGGFFKENHSIWLRFAGNEVPVKVDNKEVYLATQENLNSVTIGKVFFHPACENVVSKETEIFKVIRTMSAARIYEIFIPITEVLVMVANRKQGKSLPSKTLEMLTPFKGLSNVVRDEVREILKICSIHNEDKGIDTRIIHFTMIKGGKNENGETISYTATPSFPFYTEVYRVCAQNSHLKDADRISFVNTTFTAGALRAVVNMFEAVFTGITDPTSYRYELTTPECARLVAFIHSYALVANDINAFIGKFRKDFDPIGIFGIDLEYVSDIDSIEEIRGLIPPLEYNNYNRNPVPDEIVSASPVNNSILSLFNAAPANNGQVVTNQNNGQNTPMKQPPSLPGERFIGATQHANGIVEFRFRNDAQGVDRVVCHGESGNFISSSTQPISAYPTMPQSVPYPGTGYPTVPGYPSPYQNPYAQPNNYVPLVGVPGVVQTPYGAFITPAAAPAPAPVHNPYEGSSSVSMTNSILTPMV